MVSFGDQGLGKKYARVSSGGVLFSASHLVLRRLVAGSCEVAEGTLCKVAAMCRFSLSNESKHCGGS